MIAIGVRAVVMIVSTLRKMCRMERPNKTAVSSKKCVLMTGPSLTRPCRRCPRGEEDVLQRRLLLDVLDVRWREQLLQFGEGAVRDDAALMQDGDPVGELLSLLEILRGEENRGPLLGKP